MTSTDFGPYNCIYGEWVTGSMTGGTYFDYIAGFGELLNYAQYTLLREDEEVRIDPLDTTPAMLKKTEELKEAKDQLEALRKRYEAEGYHVALGEELVRISNKYFYQRKLEAVFVVPDDASALLDYFGNPLIEEDEDDDEDEDDTAPAPVFDITNPTHWQAMQARIEWHNENM